VVVRRRESALVTVAELEPAISREAREYPAWLLAGCETGLCLFAAAFLGVNDVVHFARRRIATVAVDRDAGRLEQMRAVYPGCVELVAGDAFEFVERARAAGRVWDAISVDPFLGDATERVRANLPAFLELARKVATVTIPFDAPAPVVDGWQASTIVRSPAASWLVLTRV
jgi:hypothetical protein